MKKMKYLFAGIFAFSVALGVNAQTVDYKEALKPITTALESSSNDPKVLKDLVKTYKKQFIANTYFASIRFRRFYIFNF